MDSDNERRRVSHNRRSPYGVQVTAPFRSLGRIAVSPRPYQFVPLIMALRQDPVRLLIADDVGVGKTVEAGLIARELLDRGVARRLAVICPSHLCDQWEADLRDKFGIEAAVVQPSRIAKLERALPRQDVSLYQYYPHLIVSIDFVKTERNRVSFLLNAPDLVIVDEAHVAARPRGDARGSQQQRYEFLRTLMEQGKTPHLVLVTATPHSGIEENFRSLLGLLDVRFDSAGLVPASPLDRHALLPHLVQRRRGDVERWLGSDTPFPKREPLERTYALSAHYHALFDGVLAYCRSTVVGANGLRAQQQRVQYWAAIGLLRCVLSSPAAAVAALAERARKGGVVETAEASLEEIDATYEPQVLDTLDEERAGDYLPVAPMQNADAYLDEAGRRMLAQFLQRARALVGVQHDGKLAVLVGEIAGLLRDGYRPIVFCRYIATANYLSEQLHTALRGEFPGLRVAAVTGEIGDDERREKIADLAQHPVRVLVATDCLSEGINLQESFDAVIHYDLPWNPNRLEQREGRVDRYGQRRDTVRTTLLYGADNPVDRVVLDVLIRKARTIRTQLGVAVPVPDEGQQVVQAVVDSVLLSVPTRQAQLQFAFEDAAVSRLHHQWDAAAKKQRDDRAYFAQHAIKPEEVASEIAATAPVLGDADAVHRFIADAAQRLGGSLTPTLVDNVYDLDAGKVHPLLDKNRFGTTPLRVAFEGGASPAAVVLGRTHPIVAAFCDAVLGAALAPVTDDDKAARLFARCGARITDAVTLRTGVLLLHMRYLLREHDGTETRETFAEEVAVATFERRDGLLVWCEPFGDEATDLLARASSVANMTDGDRADHVRWALDLVERTPDVFAPVVAWRQGVLRESHDRLRKVIKQRRLEIRMHAPPDVLGCYVLVPGRSR